MPSVPSDPEAQSQAGAVAPIRVGGLSAAKTFVLAALGLLLLTLIAYWPLHTAGYIWDDSGWLVNNHFVHHWRGLWNIWFEPKDSIQYYPLVFTAFNIQWHLWGANTFAYHLVNILVQAVDAILLWRVLVNLNLRSAWVAAAIWAIHPVQVESVGWVVEQKSLLSALFLFPAILAWMRFSGIRSEHPPGSPFLTPREWRMYILGTLAYILALSAKTDVCIIPIVLLLVLGWKRGSLHRRDVLLLTPWLLLGFIAALVTIHIEHSQVGANGPEFHFTIAQHLIIAGRDLWFYPVKLLWPWPLMAVYPRWHISHPAIWEWIFPITGFAVPVVLLALSRKIGRGPFVAVAAYGLMISPLLGFIAFYTEIYTFVADHYQYLACIGIIVLITEGVAGLLHLYNARLKVATDHIPADQENLPTSAETSDRAALIRRLTMSISALVLLVLGTITWVQCETYTPPEHLWTHDLKYYPNSWVAMEHIGTHELEHGKIHAGLSLLHQSDQLSHGGSFVINSDLGDAYRALGDYARAISYYRHSLSLAPIQPATLAHLVQCYQHLGNWRQAYTDLLHGVQLLPRSAALQVELADMLVRARHPQLAIPHYLMAIKYEPDNTHALFGLAQAFQSVGRWDKAVRYYRRTFNVSPGFGQGHFIYGVGLLQHGQPAAAAHQFQTVLQLGRHLRFKHGTLGKQLCPEPWRIETHQQLARALQMLHHPKQAANQDAIVASLILRQKQWAADHQNTTRSSGHGH